MFLCTKCTLWSAPKPDAAADDKAKVAAGGKAKEVRVGGWGAASPSGASAHAAGASDGVGKLMPPPPPASVGGVNFHVGAGVKVDSCGRCASASLYWSLKDALDEVLKTVTINEPRITVYSNVTAKPFTKAAEIAGLLKRQLVEPVMWESSVKAIIASGKTDLYELGPGQQIKAMTKRIDVGVWKQFKNITA